MPEPAPPHQLEAVERARTFMLEHFREDLSVRRIASEACLSPYHFIRSFKAATGETPYRYLRRVRLSNARFLLRTTDSSVTRIAHDSGFASLSHFSDAFSAETGASPTDFRRGG
jgi:AraC family transcriptional regulator